MSDFTRRDVLKTGVTATAAITATGISSVQTAPTWNNKPEAGASICVLRWKQFIQAGF